MSTQRRLSVRPNGAHNVTVVLEATGVRRLNAQSPSELRWRLRVKSGHIYRFDNMVDLKHP